MVYASFANYFLGPDSVQVELGNKPDPFHGIPLRYLPSEDTASLQALQTIGNWIDDCVNNHEFCNGGFDQVLPKRILEITATHVYLRDSDYTRGRQSRYACLSHCWGTEGPALRHTSVTAEILKGGIAIKNLPQTFMDAAQVCLQLPIRYLWIDAICE